MKRKLFLLIATTLFAHTAPTPAQAQIKGPSDLNFDGTLYSAAGTPVTQASVNFKIEIWDKSSTCVLYSEQHLAKDLSQTKGSFFLNIGSGSSPVNYLAGNASFDSGIFLNKGAVAPFTGCGAGLTLATGDSRSVRIYYDLGSGYVAMSPDFSMSTVPYAMIADSVGGKTASDFIHINAATQLTQVNADYVFSSTNYPKLKALVDGTDTQYQTTNPTAAVSMNSQRLINVADPTGAQDVVTKSYDDSNLAGRAIDAAGVGVGFGGGRTIVWDQVQNKWITSNAGSVAWVAAGAGLVPGTITSYGTLSVDVGTTAGKILQLNGSAQLPGVDGSLLSNVSAIKLQGYAVSAAAPLANQVLTWNSTTGTWEPGFAQSGTVTGLSGDVTASGSGVVTAIIAANAITSAKINNIGISVNRLLITDAITGTTVGYASCANQEIMQWNASGWSCTPIAPILASNGALLKTGNAFNTNMAIGTTDNYSVDLITNSVSRIRISAAGNVGFGTTAPTQAVDVDGTIRTFGALAGLQMDGTINSGGKIWNIAAGSGGGTGDGSPGDENAYIRIGRSGINPPTVIGPDGRMMLGYTGTGWPQDLPKSMLDVNGGVAIGSFAGTTPAPSDGMIVSGPVGVGTPNPMGNFAIQSNSGNPAASGGFDPALGFRVGTNNNAIDMGVSDAWAAGWIQTRMSAINGTIAYLNLNPLGGAVQVGGYNAPNSSNEFTVWQNGTANALVAKGSTGNLLAIQNPGGTNLTVIDFNGRLGVGTGGPTATLDVNGHVANSGGAATVGSCGTSPTINGNDTRGKVTTGTSASGCTVTFNQAYSTVPICVVSWNGAPSSTGISSVPSTTTLQVNFTAPVSASFSYYCMQ